VRRALLVRSTHRGGKFEIRKRGETLKRGIRQRKVANKKGGTRVINSVCKGGGGKCGGEEGKRGHRRRNSRSRHFNLVRTQCLRNVTLLMSSVWGHTGVREGGKRQHDPRPPGVFL